MWLVRGYIDVRHASSKRVPSDSQEIYEMFERETRGVFFNGCYY